MENTASDLSARLLATENLSVIRARTQTASFDIKSRVLTLPLWKDMTPEIEDMLIGHEVGHALYTGEEYLNPIRENAKMMSYLNIVEDVRIEKLMKRRYPGLRKRMNEGYKQLNDRDFFGVKQVQSFDDLLLIDKINLYFKAGFQCGVTFTPEEKQFVNRAERVETIEEVIELANDIYTFSKEQMEERKKRIKEENPTSEEFEDGDDDTDDDGFDGDIDNWGEDSDVDKDSDGGNQKPKSKPQEMSDEAEQQKKQSNDGVSDEELESKTERVFSKNLEDLADTNTEYKYWKFDKDYFNDPVIGFKKILTETLSPEQFYASEEYDHYTRYMNPEEKAQFAKKTLGDYAKFKTESSSTVNYLVKEFEMKKSAQTYKRAQVSKIGSLDMSKIYAYKLKDDLFKRVTMLPQGKNHGMIMLVDWSGSMNDVLHDTLEQVINLAMFCNRTKIPYRVFAFTNGYPSNVTDGNYDAYRAWASRKEDSGLLTNATSRFNLLELFSNKMTASEFNSMAKRVLHYSFQNNTGYSTSSTPLNEALVWCYEHIGTYMKHNNIEKMTFITLTDGDGHQLTGVSEQITTMRYESRESYKKVKVKNFIKDPVTQKTYELSMQGAEQTEMILRMMKDRYGISVVGFHICGSGRRELEQVMKCNLPKYAGDSYSMIEAWRKSFRTDGFVSLKNTGRDDLFLITKQSTKIEEGVLETNADMNAKAIAKNFGKYLNVKKTSRVLLNRFVTLVA